MEFRQQIIFCSKGFPIVLESMNRLGKIVTEGYDPYGQPQPQKSSTLGKVAKWGGLGALALGGLGLANPEMVRNITGSDTLQNAFQSGHDKIANAYDWFSGGKLSGKPVGAVDASVSPGGNTSPAVENPAANNATPQPTANQTQPAAQPTSEPAKVPPARNATDGSLAQPEQRPDSSAGQASGGQLHQAENQAAQNAQKQMDDLDRQRNNAAQMRQTESNAQKQMQQVNDQNQAAVDRQNSLNNSDRLEAQRNANLQANQNNFANQQSLNNSDKLEAQRNANLQARQSVTPPSNPNTGMASGGQLQQAESRAGVNATPSNSGNAVKLDQVMKAQGVAPGGRSFADTATTAGTRIASGQANRVLNAGAAKASAAIGGARDALSGVPKRLTA